MMRRAHRPLIAIVHGALDLARPDEQDTVDQAKGVASALERLGFNTDIVALGLDLSTLERMAARPPALVFNLAEALGGDGRLVHLVPYALEHLGMPFTGSSATALLSTSDKLLAKRFMAADGLPTPAWSTDGCGLDPEAPVIVKSVAEHASFGIDAASVVPGSQAARAIADRKARFGGTWFAEAYVDGREFNLALLAGPDGPQVLPPAEILFLDYPPDRPKIVDYEAKWHEAAFAYRNTPRQFLLGPQDQSLLAELEALALRAWRLFRLGGYARVDFRVDPAGRASLLEVNANPCVTPEAGFAATAAEAGLSYDDVIARIVEAACPGLVADAQRTLRPRAARSAARRPRLVPPTLDWRTDVGAEDVEAVRGLAQATGFFSEPEQAVAAELVAERLERGPASGYEFLFAEERGRLVGYACYGPIAGASGAWDLYWIIVHPDRWRGGVGRALLQRCETAMAAEGARRIYIETSGRAQYAPTRAFYERLGYRREARLAEFYGPGDAKCIYTKAVRPAAAVAALPLRTAAG